MLHTIRTKQILKSDLPTVWEFVRSPKNLATITPDYMGFHIHTSEGELSKMHAGQLIEYTVSPVLGIKMHWVTEITHVEELRYFVDEQRFGPYRFWHHKHYLKAIDGGVEMIDVVHYSVGFGLLGRIINALFVQKKIEGIFEYRRVKLTELFG